MHNTLNFSVACLVDEQAVENIFTGRTDLLVRWSSGIEKAIINYQLKTPVYVGVQHLRQFKPILERYRRIASFAHGVWVFGQSDAEPMAVNGLHYVSLHPDDKLVREWFLVVNEAAYARALVAREITPPGTPQAQRMFQGVLTSDRSQITRIAAALVTFCQEHVVRAR
jgi:DICT domain-containing protein